MITRIAPSSLDVRVLQERIYPDIGRTYYWSDRWDPDFYVALARAGFISISTMHPDLGAVLLPELQSSYAVLDWNDLHVSRKVRSLLQPRRLEEDGIELRIGTSCEPVVERLAEYHGSRSWLTPTYRRLLARLPTGARTDFALSSIELWSRRHERLVAGELGYAIGRTYTSLSGFCDRSEKRWRDFGTLQLVLLARSLRDRGYAFWNLGHPHLAYKRALGARVAPRIRFLERWLDARDAVPDRPLVNEANASHWPSSIGSGHERPLRSGRGPA